MMAKVLKSVLLEEIELVSLDDLKGVMERGEIGAFASAAAFPFLKSLSIYQCNKMRKVEIYISSCEDIQEIFEEDEGTAAGSTLTLPKLTSLRLGDLPRLKSISKATSLYSSIPLLHFIETLILWLIKIFNYSRNTKV